MDEKGEDGLLDTFQITPGELHAKLEIADWLMYCVSEIARLLKHQAILTYLRRIRVRLHYGIKEELLELVSLRDIGRMRARRMFNAGIKDFSVLKKTHIKRLENILGPNISRKVLQQLEQK
jgi:helicase